MINLKDVSYVRLGTPDMEAAETFATSCLGLQVAERAKKALYLRSDDRSHTLCYTEGDPADQTVGFEVEDEDCLQQAAATLERVSHRIGDIPLMRVNAIHHTIALVRAPKPGIQHVNHQVESDDDVLRSYYFLSERRVPIVFGPGRHPTSGARFLYFTGPDGMVFEYSVGVDEIEDEATHRPRQFGFEPTSFCMWGSKPAGMALPNEQ